MQYMKLQKPYDFKRNNIPVFQEFVDIKYQTKTEKSSEKKENFGKTL